MKAKMWFAILVLALMGALSSAVAGTGTQGQPSEFFTFNNIWAKSGTTVSALFQGYHKNGGRYSYKEFLLVYCTLQQMKSCKDADFRKLPIGNWKVPAAPVAYYLKNGKEAPETFTFTLVKKSHNIYTPTIFEVRAATTPVTESSKAQVAAPTKSSEKSVAPAIVGSAPKIVTTQSAVKLPVVKPVEKMSTVVQPKTTTAMKVPHEVKLHNLLPQSIHTGDPVAAPSPADRDHRLMLVIALAAFVAGLGTAFVVWAIIRRARPKQAEDLYWPMVSLEERISVLQEKHEKLLMKGRGIKTKIIKEFFPTVQEMEVSFEDVIRKLMGRCRELSAEIVEAQKVARRFDLPKDLMWRDGTPYLYLAKVDERVAVANNPDPMRLTAVFNHLMNNEQSRDFYNIKLERRGEKFDEVVSLPGHAKPAPC